MKCPLIQPARVSGLGNIIDGKNLAKTVRAEARTGALSFLTQHGRKPKLAVVLASNDPASEVYVRNKGRAAENAEIDTIQKTFAPDGAPEELLAAIDELNADDRVDGILVQLPVPAQHDAERIIDRIRADKDVDGFHRENAGRLARDDESGLIPCTPLGCIRLIEESGVRIEGKHAVIIGKSRLVGQPMSELLLNRGATVTVCHSKTRHLPEHLARAEILVAAAGVPHLVQGRFVRHGATIIDVGINRRADGKLVGDVDFHAARMRARAITPVPGGVGPMTIAYLLKNTVRAAELRAAAG